MTEEARQTMDVTTSLLQTDEGVVGALIALYRLQTPDEQNSRGTYIQNCMGFNAIDAGIMSSFAEQYLSRQYLSGKQLALAKAKLLKYRVQINALQPAPLALNKPVPRVPQTSTVRKDKDLLIIRFEPTADLIRLVKAIPGRRYDGIMRQWTCPAELENLETLEKLGFAVDEATQAWKRRLSETSFEPVEVAGLKGTLRPFQKEGVGFLVSRDGRGLLGDEMGLGKTMQALAYIQHRQFNLTVVVCPATLKINWERETTKWTTLSVTSISGQEPYRVANGWRILIINYDILTFWADMLASMRPDCLILDECHYAKNKGAKRTKAVHILGAVCKHVVALSGTPITNRPIEFFETLKLLDPSLFPSFWRYAQRYCGATYNGYGWDFTGATNTLELHKKLVRTVMLRRLKSDVLKDLPPKQRIVVPISMEAKASKLYTEEESTFKTWVREHTKIEPPPLNENVEAMLDGEHLERGDSANALAQIEHLKQQAVLGKLNGCIEWIADYLESDGKLVVFCTHVETPPILHELANHLSQFNPVVVYGGVSKTKRQECVDQFQNDPKCRLFVGQLKAAGEGLTLTAASATCTIELGWTPGGHDQAEDRVHRIGQEADSVFAYYLLAEGTIEERIAAMLDDKRKNLDSVLDGKDTKDTSLLMALLDSYKKD